MTKKFERISGPVLNEDGTVTRSHVPLNGGAVFQVKESRNNLKHLRLYVPELWFTRRALEELIAELLFLKEEWDNHPIVLEQEQMSDMAVNPFDEDEEELELDEEGELEELEVPQPLRYHRVHL